MYFCHIQWFPNEFDDQLSRSWGTVAIWDSGLKRYDVKVNQDGAQQFDFFEVT